MIMSPTISDSQTAGNQQSHRGGINVSLAGDSGGASGMSGDNSNHTGPVAIANSTPQQVITLQDLALTHLKLEQFDNSL